ncbi:MAG: AraC family transcriptional regulator [Verrucomicrobiae bacterium]|nr:AraC family transcriptional regulator [Verrucomicrobiae bacterium]NNJ86613.1 helix-turn-helix domain-containing protein [Akkermansiaceae bacterium]
MSDNSPNLRPHPDFFSHQVDESDYFFLDLKPDPEADFALACGGLEYCNLKYEINRDRFEYYGMEYIVSGACCLKLAGRKYELKAGSIFCYEPHQHHEIRNTGDVPLVKFFVDFSGREVPEIIGAPFFESTVPYQMSNLRDMHALFLLMHETGKQGGRGCQRIIRQTLELIALQARFRAVDLQDASSGSFVTYEKATSHIAQHYLEINSVTQMADACHVSPGHLSRVFKLFCDESPWQMLTRLKLNRAGELLLKGEHMIKEVAGTVGFEDPYHFSRVFKKYYGVSPTRFCESMRSSSPSGGRA